MRSYCSHCGARIDEENAKFCGKCGHSLTDKAKNERVGVRNDGPQTGAEDHNRTTGTRWGAILVAFLVVGLVIALVIAHGLGGSGNALVGTWTLQSVNGETDRNKVGKNLTMTSSGNLYDNENIIAYFLNDEYTLNTWESSGGTLYFSGVFGTSCHAKYSLSGNTLTINADGDKLVFRKR